MTRKYNEKTHTHNAYACMETKILRALSAKGTSDERQADIKGRMPIFPDMGSLADTELKRDFSLAHLLNEIQIHSKKMVIITTINKPLYSTELIPDIFRGIPDKSDTTVIPGRLTHDIDLRILMRFPSLYAVHKGAHCICGTEKFRMFLSI